MNSSNQPYRSCGKCGQYTVPFGVDWSYWENGKPIGLECIDQPEPSLREQLAAIEHERWADWQKYMFSLCSQQDSGRGIGKAVDLVIPSALVERWSRQINTPYVELADKEKASDMEQVDRYWPLIQADKEAAVRAEREWALDNANKMASGIWNPELGVIAAEQRVKQLTHLQAGEGEGK